MPPGWSRAARARRNDSPRLLSALGRRAVAGQLAEVLCLGLLVVMAVNLLTVVARKSITADEVVHIPAGYIALTRGDFRPNNEHPPLAKLWSALPLLALQFV